MREALKRWGRRLLGDRATDAINERLNTLRTRRTSNRRLLVERLLPAFAEEGGRILWIGCRRYTSEYPAALESKGGECWTTDLDPEVARWGRPGRHRTGDVKALDALFPDVRFDIVLCNGVLGFGVDAPGNQAEALAAIAGVLKPGGRLLLGWNTDKIGDPVEAGLTAAFEPSPLGNFPVRMTCPPTTHIYDFLRRLS